VVSVIGIGSRDVFEDVFVGKNTLSSRISRQISGFSGDMFVSGSKFIAVF